MKEWVNLYNSGKNLSKIAKQYNCSVTKVRNFFMKNNIVMRSPGQRYVIPDKESFSRDCRRLRWYELEAKYGVSWSIIKSWKRKFNLTDGIKHDRDIVYKKTKVGCWKCASHKLSKGYPRTKNDLVAKILWEEKFCNWPGNLIMRHLCGNKWCVNPDHIVPGVQFQNNIDTLLSGKKIGMNDSVRRGLLRKAAELNIILIKDDRIIRLEDGKSFDMPSYMIDGGEA